eukprot:TRINITY_DN73588_c0_g1_i1.p1 TRINITY_DN73588_c0_g1~~TRINITY_DN73588_c0_g1_i1.p1  ORF type:complete len:751 (-),score=125.18 TRINITY_DN73588_c0_g1_i1:145-2397(-)
MVLVGWLRSMVTRGGSGCDSDTAEGAAPGVVVAEGKEQGLHRLIAEGASSLLLRECLCSNTSLGDVLRCGEVCRSWCQMSREQRWLKCSIVNGGVSGGAQRRSLWRYLSQVEILELQWRAKLSHEDHAGGDLDSHAVFEMLASRPLPHGKVGEIERDVHRTFPNHDTFRGAEGSGARADLLRILRAVAAAEPDVGYCQGMNFIAATLLLNLGGCAADAFWMLLVLLDGYHFRHLFAPGVPQLPLRSFQFCGLVRERLPRLWRHLKEENFSMDIFAHQCVLTLFAYSIEPQFLAYVYDVFFLLGWKAIFRLGLGLLASMETRLLSMNIEDISRFLQNCKQHFDPRGDGGPWTPQSGLQKLLKFKVRSDSIVSLQNSFQLERWETLLERAAMEAKEDSTTEGDCGNRGRLDGDPLPAGVDRSPCKTNFLLDRHALHAKNMPPRRPSTSNFENCESDASSSASATVSAVVAPSVSEKTTPRSTAVRWAQQMSVPIALLLTTKSELDSFDAETIRDISVLRIRIAEIDKELGIMLRDTEALRVEVRQAEMERQELLEYKRAVMDATHAAVKTSADALAAVDSNTKSNEESSSVSSSGWRERQDDLVQQCLEKVNRVESDIIEKGHSWEANMRELEPLIEQIQDLQEMKDRSMTQLSAFIELRIQERRGMMEASLRRALPEAVFDRSTEAEVKKKVGKRHGIGDSVGAACQKACRNGTVGGGAARTGDGTVRGIDASARSGAMENGGRGMAASTA